MRLVVCCHWTLAVRSGGTARFDAVAVAGSVDGAFSWISCCCMGIGSAVVVVRCMQLLRCRACKLVMHLRLLAGHTSWTCVCHRPGPCTCSTLSKRTLERSHSKGMPSMVLDVQLQAIAKERRAAARGHILRHSLGRCPLDNIILRSCWLACSCLRPCQQHHNAVQGTPAGLSRSA